jgi:hypothetical protein
MIWITQINFTPHCLWYPSHYSDSDNTQFHPTLSVISTTLQWQWQHTISPHTVCDIHHITVTEVTPKPLSTLFFTFPTEKGAVVVKSNSCWLTTTLPSLPAFCRCDQPVCHTVQHNQHILFLLFSSASTWTNSITQNMHAVSSTVTSVLWLYRAETQKKNITPSICPPVDYTSAYRTFFILTVVQLHWVVTKHSQAASKFLVPIWTPCLT